MTITDEKRLNKLETKLKSGYINTSEARNPIEMALAMFHEEVCKWTGTEEEWYEYESLMDKATRERIDKNTKAHVRALALDFLGK